MSIKAYRFQLRTRPGVERLLRRFTGSCRWAWNAAIAEQRRRREAGEKFSPYAAMCRWLTEWRHAPETAWLAQAPIHPLQQTLRRLEAAYQRFFAGRGGYPKFKRRGQEPGLRFPDPKQFALDQGNARVKLPKLGWLRMRQSQAVVGELRNATVTAERGKWFVSLQVEQPDVLPSAELMPTLGIDLGVALFAALSDGRTVEPLDALKQQQRRLKHAQRAVSRKVKGSRNRRKAVDRLGRLHARIAAQRNDWLHKLTTELADQHPAIAIEELKVAAMSASAAGTADAPGQRVRQKAGLNRAILDQGWAEFRRQLEYKCAARGGAVVAVNPAYTSQTCSRCGCVDAGNRTAQAIFACLACGHAENADVNAAHNILAAGRAVWAARPTACGAEVSRASPARGRRAAAVKQEPTEATPAAAAEAR
ncbi:RNA-guided endonuclease InsQ/TnpB family protein [Azohydromonas australica]|uniref:RNA-guided endonuclease InsQ/TnpB family protein n=1 Tax=Azohydromonas australica TaxID=364039 RepID=UPI0004003143|nr:RNA-guided endonuclease TnpB family protein [Azohydromonas australica]